MNRTRDPINHPARPAVRSDLKRGIQAALDESLCALTEAILDLSDEQTRAFPINGRNCIAWIAVECIMNLDRHANSFQTGSWVMADSGRWKVWWDLFWHERDRQPDPSAHFPPHAERVAADYYFRTIAHMNAHIRQIWLLRGALGLTARSRWPRQHWH